MSAHDHPKDRDVVIVAAARTPQGRLKGQLASFTAPQLGAFAIRGALEQGSIDPSEVDAVICLLYTSPSPRDATLSRMPSYA